MKKQLLTATFLIIVSIISNSLQAVAITGAGSSFVYPVLSRWLADYHKLSGIAINYQPIGSGGGIRQLNAHTIDFAASDKPLESNELSKKSYAQFPVVVGGVVVCVNIPNLPNNALTLDGDTLANIFIGRVKKWNDTSIQKLNPKIKLPDQNITVVHRSDGSGTTFNFTNYLIKVSPEWKQKIGSNTMIQWPTGVGGKGNAGVSSYIKSIPYSIGYVELAYALQLDLKTTAMINKDGKTVEPSLKTFSAAAVNANWKDAEDFHLILTDQPGADSWPIAAAVFILMPEHPKDTAQTKQILDFFDYCYNKGGEAASKLDYVTMSDEVVKLIQNYWSKSIKNPDGKPIWK